MVAHGMLLALYIASQRRRRMKAVLQDLKRRIHEEKLRVEWRRLVRIRHYVTLDILKDPSQSAWADVWALGTDKNLITLTSLSRSAFAQLLDQFIPFYYIPIYNPRGGRPRKLQHHHQVLGLLLAFYVGSMHRSSLCITFGVPPSTLARVLNEAEDALHNALQGFHPARIVSPTIARQKALARLVARRQPLVQFAWGFLDGKNYRVLQPSDPDIQNAHYNGWLHGVFVTGTICFAADGLTSGPSIIAQAVGTTQIQVLTSVRSLSIRLSTLINVMVSLPTALIRAEMI